MDPVITAAAIGAGGALLGVSVSQLLEIFRLNRTSAMRQKEKIIDKRITAHETIIELSESMIAAVMPDIKMEVPEDTEKPIRAVGVLWEKSMFENWWSNIFYSCYRHHMWLAPKPLKELNLIQDYIVNLNRIISQIDDNELKRLSVIVRPDFISLSGNLRREAINYLSKDAINFKLKDLNRHHKYAKPVFLRRLNATELYKNYSDYLT